MKAKTKNPYPSIRIFQNDHLERLTHIHPIGPLLVWVPFVVYLTYYSMTSLGFSVSAVLMWAAIGLFVWTLSEYLLHRWIFHFKPHGAFQTKVEFLIHGNHHADPNDPTRLVMPPAGAIILAIVLFSFFHFIFRLFGAADSTVPFFAFFVVGYLCYDYTHYAIHHFTPRTKFGKFVKQHHMNHHFVATSLNWGVSSPLWDYVLGTIYTPKSAKGAKRDRSFKQQPV